MFKVKNLKSNSNYTQEKEIDQFQTNHQGRVNMPIRCHMTVECFGDLTFLKKGDTINNDDDTMLLVIVPAAATY